jgi:hypothetical protein
MKLTGTALQIFVSKTSKTKTLSTKQYVFELNTVLMCSKLCNKSADKQTQGKILHANTSVVVSSKFRTDSEQWRTFIHNGASTYWIPRKIQSIILKSWNASHFMWQKFWFTSSSYSQKIDPNWRFSVSYLTTPQVCRILLMYCNGNTYGTSGVPLLTEITNFLKKKIFPYLSQ